MQQGGENEREKKPSKDGGGERSRKQTAKEILGERSLVEYRKKKTMVCIRTSRVVFLVAFSCNPRWWLSDAAAK